ncbi:LacI family DNA-binding transcriptional regulator [Nonomuraea zeae]|uniref:LacI family transcriptional regulator n=1 Tax=Nonomuraea zeae TaxID=1642303 RepID=A0A5S4G1R1_9ACTN|nr:LacI family DNA-binding transcriptional regulator [Nonomuraea zeae]TMR19129.1 LacI family transcriptional regulator [Nonomuraea zeae]
MTPNPSSAPTLRDVAEAAGVHTATASRALNPKTRQQISAETARRVMRAAQALGYQPNSAARSLKTSRTSTVGLVIPDLTNPLFPPIVRGVESVLESSGYNVWIVNTDNDEERERAKIESLRSRQVEGLIVATARLDHPLLQQLHEQGVTMVLINRQVGDLRIPAVTGDDATGVAAGVRHLAELGHTRIAHLSGPLSTSTGLVRSQAFRHAVRDRGLAGDAALVVECARWSEDDGAAAMRELLERDTGCTAVVAGNDLIALGCYDVFAERGLSCPDDLSVIGFNDMPFLDKLRPPLTTVAVPHHELGAEAARMLLDCIGEPERPARSLLLPVSLIVRGSTAPPRA